MIYITVSPCFPPSDIRPSTIYGLIDIPQFTLITMLLDPFLMGVIASPERESDPHLLSVPSPQQARVEQSEGGGCVAASARKVLRALLVRHIVEALQCAILIRQVHLVC